MRRCLGFLLVLLVFRVSIAQENTVLPDLAPTEVEIVGDLTISFPSLRRQPLVGFNPPPRVPDIPASRQPYTAAYKQPSADLPPSPLRTPEPPPVSTIANREPYRGLVEAGVGRYFERYIRVDMTSDLNERTTITVRGHYDGSSGYTPFSSDPKIKTPSNSQFAVFGIKRNGSHMAIGLDASARRHAYTLFGATPAPGSISRKNPSRRITDLKSTVFIESRPGVSVSGRVSVGVSHSTVDTDIFDPVIRIDPATEITENGLRINGTLGFSMATGRIQIETSMAMQGLEKPGFARNTISSGSTALGYRFGSTDGLQTTLGARLSGFEAIGQSSSGSDRSLVFVSPSIRFDFPLRPGVEFFAADQPELSPVSITDIYALTPYAEDEPSLQPELTSTHILAGVRTFGDHIHARLQAGWKDIKNRRYVESPSAPHRGYDLGYPVVRYEDASILYGEAEITAVLKPGIQATIHASYRDGKLDKSDSVIPYFSPVTYGASVSVGMYGGSLLIQFSALGETSRYRDRAKTVRIGAVMRFDMEASYYATPQAGITVGVRNMSSNREYWENYAPEASVFYTGVRWRW